MQSVNTIPVEFIVTDENVVKFGLPAYQTIGSAGMDLRAMFEHDTGSPTLTLEPDEVVLIPSGLKVFIKDPNYLGFILPRSGLGHKRGLVLGNLIGCLDSDFQSDLQISLWNRSDETQTIHYGDRIAQLVFMPVVHAQLLRVQSFEATERGEGGWGHTGVN